MNETAKEPSTETPEATSVPGTTNGRADGYNVKLKIFEGPLDLLLFLIRKKKIDIHDIPIAAITGDYLEYLDRKEQINLNREAEFLFIAALLIYIKSQMLLPRETDLGESEDPRRLLVDRLLEYQKIKAACSLLRDREAAQLQIWRRNFLPPIERKDDFDLLDISLFDLAATFFIIKRKNETGVTQVIKSRDVTLEKKMKQLLELLREKRMLDFLEYFESQGTLAEALISFFCVLELVKSRVAMAAQDDLFRTIRVWLREEGHGPVQHE